MNPNWFGIAVVTVDGHVYQVGDTQQAFTMQSISKVITYGIALEDNGIEAVLGKNHLLEHGEGKHHGGFRRRIRIPVPQRVY